MSHHDIVEIDPCFVWCTQHLEELLPFKNGMVGIKLPEGIIASGETQEKFEVSMNALVSEQANHLYVVHAGIFFEDFKPPLIQRYYS